MDTIRVYCGEVHLRRPCRGRGLVLFHPLEHRAISAASLRAELVRVV